MFHQFLPSPTVFTSPTLGSDETYEIELVHALDVSNYKTGALVLRLHSSMVPIEVTLKAYKIWPFADAVGVRFQDKNTTPVTATDPAEFADVGTLITTSTPAVLCGSSLPTAGPAIGTVPYHGSIESLRTIPRAPRSAPLPDINRLQLSLQLAPPPPGVFGLPEPFDETKNPPRAVKLWEFFGVTKGLDALQRPLPRDMSFICENELVKARQDIIQNSAGFSTLAVGRALADLQTQRLHCNIDLSDYFQVRGGVDFDRHYGLPTASLAGARANIAATDLGIPIHVGTRRSGRYLGKMLFLFGDTWKANRFGAPHGFDDVGECYGWTEANQPVFDPQPASAPTIRFFTEYGGYVPLLMNLVRSGELNEGNLGGARGGLGGFYAPTGDSVYVFFVVDAEDLDDGGGMGDKKTISTRLKRTIVARASQINQHIAANVPPNWKIVLDDTGPLMRSVAPVLIDEPSVSGAGTEGPINRDDFWVYMFGTDANYRKSSIYLARCRLSALDPVAPLDASEPRPFEYLQHVDYSLRSEGVPTWSMNHKEAMPLFDTGGNGIGQLHVVIEPRSGLWLMSHDAPGSIDLRWARSPWGPWGSTRMKNPNTGRLDALIVDPAPVQKLFDGDRDFPGGNTLHSRISPQRVNGVLQTSATTGELRTENESNKIPPCLSIRQPNPSNRSRYDEHGDDGLGDDILGSHSSGGAYGGYLVAPWFRYRSDGEKQLVDVVFTLATGNPYRVVLHATAFELSTKQGATVETKAG